MSYVGIGVIVATVGIVIGVLCPFITNLRRGGIRILHALSMQDSLVGSLFAELESKGKFTYIKGVTWTFNYLIYLFILAIFGAISICVYPIIFLSLLGGVYLKQLKN